MENKNNNFGYDEDEALKKHFTEIKDKSENKSEKIKDSIPSQKELATKNIQIRMALKDIDVLERYLRDEKGYRSFSTGLRWILFDFIKRNDLK